MVGALIASDGGIPDLVIIRRVSGICASALAVGGVDAALSATPFFTAHTYSLDSMTPTAPRMDLPNPFQPPKGRGALDARRCKAKPGEALTQAGTALRVSQIIASLFRGLSRVITHSRYERLTLSFIFTRLVTTDGAKT